MIKRKLRAGPLLMGFTVLAATVSQATTPVIVFQADFEGSAVTDASNGSLTANNLNAGTATGTWAIDADGGTAGNHAAVITTASGAAKALSLATGAYDATAIFSGAAPLEE